MKKGRKKDLSYYMRLRYPIEVIPIPDEEGGGYMARMPQFGDAIIGDGDTPEEAIADLNRIKEEVFRMLLEKGESLPEPEKEEYSGRFIVRVPKYLHRALVEEAKRNSVSLNQFVNDLLSQALANYKAITYIENFYLKQFEIKYNILPKTKEGYTDDYRQAA